MSHKRKLHGQEHVGHGRDGHGCGGYKDKNKYKSEATIASRQLLQISKKKKASDEAKKAARDADIDLQKLFSGENPFGKVPETLPRSGEEIHDDNPFG